MIKLIFEPDFKSKILFIHFEVGSHLEKQEDVLSMREQWMQALKAWHAPYKALINCDHLTIIPSEGTAKALKIMGKILSGLYLKKAACFKDGAKDSIGLMPFDAFNSEEEASAFLNIRSPKKPTGGKDFRSLITLDAHFKDQVIEMSAVEPICFDEKSKITALKEKILNHLMQWHSGWNLVIDCQNITFDQSLEADVKKLIKVLKGVFMKQIIGYGSRQNNYPFDVYLSRHKAMTFLEQEHFTSGDEANCKSRKE